MNIAIAQINTIPGDLEGNTVKIIDYIDRAKKKGAELVVFPELAITGYPPKDLLLKPSFIKKNMEKLNLIARHADTIAVIVGYVHEEKGKLYNSAGFLFNGKVKGMQHKLNLPNFDVFDEKRYFTPGDKPKVFKFDKHYIGINVCEDLWVDSNSIALQHRRGANLIVNISGSPFNINKDTARRELISKKAKDNRIPIVYCNLVGCNDGLVFDGRSYVINSDGSILAKAKDFEEELLFTDLLTHNKVSYMDEMTEIYNALLLGIKDYVYKNNFGKVVVAVSGGLDSAVVVTLAVHALGKENVVGVFMPSPVTSRQSKKDAKKICENLGVEFYDISIKYIMWMFSRALSSVFKGTKENVAEENIQARIRGTLLMAIANKFNYLVLSTGNKSELATGYCTLYGDLTGGLAVIGDLYKTKVKELANFINSRMASYLIPTSIIEKEPSAELRKGQLDTDSLPKYEILDVILRAYIEEFKSKEEIEKLLEHKEVVAKVISMVDKAEFKRQQAPIVLKMTPVAFGDGRRMPITNRFRQD